MIRIRRTAPSARPSLDHPFRLPFAAGAVLFFFLLAQTAFAQGTGPKLPNPGFRSIGLWNPDIPIRMDIAIWYPSPRIPRDLLLEGWSIQVGQNGITIAGKYPVILLSHTTAGSRLSSYDLAATLARHGFMVIAPTHPADNMDDAASLFHASLFIDRPRHLLLALEAVEQHSILGQIMDKSRVGVLGVGAGAATALQLAGAKPDLTRLEAYCPPVTEPAFGDPYCSPWGKLFHHRMQTEFAALLAENPERLTPAEQPVLAVGLLTPGLIGLFPDASLANVTAPVGILAVANDTVYPARQSVDRLQQTLPHRPASRVLNNAVHFDVQAPCPPMFQESFTALCGERNSSAEEFRKIRTDFFVRFFQKTLGPPVPPPDTP